jgi:hypothetical protein
VHTLEPEELGEQQELGKQQKLEELEELGEQQEPGELEEPEELKEPEDLGEAAGAGRAGRGFGLGQEATPAKATGRCHFAWIGHMAMVKRTRCTSAEGGRRKGTYETGQQG